MGEPGPARAQAALDAILSEGAEGTYLVVHLRPGARRSGVAGVHGGALKIAVADPPLDGRANRAMLGLLAGLFGVGKDRLELVTGHSSRRKRILIREASLAEVRKRLETALAQQ